MTHVSIDPNYLKLLCFSTQLQLSLIFCHQRNPMWWLITTTKDLNEKKSIPHEQERVVLRVIGLPYNFKHPVSSKLLMSKKYVLTAVDMILASFFIAVVLTPSTVIATGTTLFTLATVLKSFFLRIMAYATAAALECAGTWITGKTGSRTILPLASLGTKWNENALLPLRMEAVVLRPVSWVCEVIGCCSCGEGSSGIRLGVM